MKGNGKWMGLAVAAALAPAAVAAGPSGEFKLEAGYRGVSLPVAGHQLVNLKPGDHVDVLVTFEAALKDHKETVTATILQNVLVLNLYKEDATVVLKLNAKEAQYAVLSIDPKKALWLILRPEGDAEMHPIEMASFRKLFR